MKFHSVIKLSLALIMLGSFPVSAQESGGEPPASLKAMREAIKGISKDLNEKDRTHFLTITNNYNLTSTVDIVRRDVGKAVKACAEKNPEIKDKITDRFTKWEGAVVPVIDEARGHIDNMILAQDYISKEAIEDVFHKIDATREETEGKIEKVPVTTLQACNVLYNKMDETQETVVKLLRQMLISYPQSLAQDEKPETAAPEEKEPEEKQEQEAAPAPELSGKEEAPEQPVPPMQKIDGQKSPKEAQKVLEETPPSGAPAEAQQNTASPAGQETTGQPAEEPAQDKPANGQ